MTTAQFCPTGISSWIVRGGLKRTKAVHDPKNQAESLLGLEFQVIAKNIKQNPEGQWDTRCPNRGRDVPRERRRFIRAEQTDLDGIKRM